MRNVSLAVAVSALLCVAAIHPNLDAQQRTAAKLDADLLGGGGRRAPVFVRMAQQLFPDGAAFEAFVAERGGAPRGEVRGWVLGRLRELAAGSWAEVEEPVGKLVAEGHVADVRRFWIVNGFACEADAAACEALAALPAVAFVHRQRQPGRVAQQQVVERSEAFREEGRRQLARALGVLATQGEEPVFDPERVEVAWNLDAVHAPAAWRAGATGRGVVVAVLDTGSIVTPPLAGALWRNPREEQNGEDDDGDGRVDDLVGWDCEGETPYCVGDGPRSHGSMCAGIIAGREWGDPAFVSGVAPRARLMMLRGMGRLSAYEYVAEHGADVLSMSYMWVGVELGSYRGVFRTAHEHLEACGVVSVGGAGNYGQNQPAGAQIALPKDIPCVLAVAGVLADGAVPPFSSRGPCRWDDVPFFMDHGADDPLQKPDVTACSGGFPVWHWQRFPGRKVELVRALDDEVGLIVGPRGNSFAGPHAAGVAALVLSVAPELTPWRVRALLTSTCADLGEPGRDLVTGAGMLQADRAVAAARAAVARRE
ncbi:MAG: S8 family peptidase [Planctomycetes bacterium]|nr:S8 family peptidase [Planctomycetota bacterium]